MTADGSTPLAGFGDRLAETSRRLADFEIT
jgi:hypothetical protein